MTTGNRIPLNSHLENDTQSFVVRIWHEQVDAEGYATALRGSIDHVGSNKRLYFHELDSIIGFIQEYVQMRPRDSKAKWRSWLSRIRHVGSGDE